MAKFTFQTEVSQLLQLIIHSLYSNQEIFLRELVSNASDALDRLRYLTVTDEDFKGVPFVPRIDLSFDAEAKTLTVADSGIGMSQDDLTANLGTIASSGTKRFMSSLTGDARKDAQLIGQFGVGFYAAFMVADRVEVITKRAGEDQALRWESDGKGEFSIEPAERGGTGTSVTLHLNEDGAQYASRWRLESIIKKYSNHIPFPIHLHYEEEASAAPADQEDKQKKKQDKKQKVEQINAASAVWRRPKSELKDADYIEFYKTLAHSDDEPLHWIHTHAEGAQEYTTLFYIPKQAPPDLFYSDYRPGVKLYVRRVFITDDEKELLPTYLRFVRGVIDSEDLPLNVSREILQENRVLAAIRTASVKKVLSELQAMAKKNPAQYESVFAEFGRPLKEGLYQDFSNKETLLELARFRSTQVEGLTSLAGYKERMQDDQKAIYYITGESHATLAESPLVEGYKKRGLEVLLMDDEIDEVVLPTIGTFQDLQFKSVSRADTADDLKTDEDRAGEKEIEPLLTRIKKALVGDVKDVRASAQLADSPSCVVADENDPTLTFQNLMKQMGQKDLPEVKPVLEVNPAHPIIRGLKDVTDDELLEDASRLLLEQALLIEGVDLRDPVGFSRRLNRVLARALQ